MTAFDYSIFGLRVRSSLHLPELLPAIGDGQPDVTIETASVPDERSPGQDLSVVNDGLVLVIPDIVRFRISGGNAIIVDAERGTPERNVRLYLLGSAFGALLHQRGLLPLHANAVEIDGKAVAFMGASGEGKSTLAAWFHDQGYKVIADDVCVVRTGEDGKPYALPGVARLRLWQDALEASGREAAHYERSYAFDESWNKFDVPIERTASVGSEFELCGVYDLCRSDEFRVDPLSGVDAAETVFANTYRGSYLSAAKGERNHWQSCVELVRSIPIFRLSRPSDLQRMSESFERIVDHVRTHVIESQDCG
ncbi:MAG: hypothetical protein ACTHJK_09980 [Sphingomicrobium sp.]